ncbi:hypothetical protein PAMP_004213 [Pampus punctatissimus]
MASIQEPEVQFAQRLASNEKPVRTKAVKKLRKYINGRSQKATGGFTSNELLKLWKGLFYCLWMQDKPLLQEELSNLISSLIHSFHSIDGQFLYLESFLQTFKREWTGIDRLRMDKFFQLVRFMFRQTFEMLKRKNWDSSVVGRFLELLTAQLLQHGSEAPSGLQFHILDLYMTELALLGSAELTADQNLTFIEPFCKTAAKTKDRTLFRAICSSIFSTIIDQAPFAIDDLMKEVKAAEASDSDSGQASEEEEEEEDEGKRKKKTTTSKSVGKKGPKKQINGHKSHDDDEDEDELLHLDDSDTELPCDSDVGPVLQFDYAALADKLFVLASRSNTPSHNRQRLYKIIKVLRDLSEGIFPQDEYPDEVSTDEDDDMFGSRKRMKRGGGFMEEEEEEEGAPAAKKRKGKKKEASSLEQSKDSGKDASEAADKKKKKKRKKKKKKKAGSAAGEEESEQEQPAALTQSTGKDTKGGSQAEDSETHISVSSVKVTEAAAPESQSETLLLVEVKTQAAVTVTDEDQSETLSKKKTKRETSVLEPEATEEQQAPVSQEEAAETPEPEVSPEAAAIASGKKKKKKTTGLKAESQVNAEAETTPETDAGTPAKRKKMEDAEAGSQVTNADDMPAGEEASQDATAVPLKKKTKKKQGVKMDKDKEETDQTRESSAAADPSAATPLKKNRKKSQKESESATLVEEADKLLHEMTTTPAKKKKPAAEAVGGVDEKAPLDDTEVGSSSRKLAKKKKKIPVTFEFEADELKAATSINGSAEEAADVEDPSTPLSTKQPKKKTKALSGSDFVTFQNETTVPTPLFCRTKGSPGTPLSRKKKSPKQTPKSESKKVTFGLKNNKTAEFRKTDRSLLVSPDGSSRVPFDPQQKPKFGVLKSPPTLRSTSVKKTPNKKKSVTTPKSTPKCRPSAADFF